ncbi:helix-turn-helix domain-containing protein [Virgibacillus sp. AGTR]|uniref:helix-turn-helix domain-containing protein n=1 Tax=unclassified Virgibacillus TaxID=2620237 RepID=UPI001D162AEE|nr:MULTISPECIES: helix-turn-helix domain-containing protein [unclassified Virgibacillus]MCC2251461.1 helix-turn-helix domain-containing protein [Virgibacillus sp. AGTR]MDY7044860.1 helix-turn-helix domain-containing protein [Virgibacillus sp. M23]
MDNQSLLSALEEGNLLRIISFFEPSIRKNLRNTPYQERSDLEQEITIKILEKIEKLQLLEVPTFFEFIDCGDG